MGIGVGFVFSLFPLYIVFLACCSNLPHWLSPLLEGLNPLVFQSPILFIFAVPGFAILAVVAFYIRKPLWGIACLSAFLVVGISVFSMPRFANSVYDRARERGMNRTIDNAKPLLAALEEYRETKGRYPAILDLLVPDFIDRIPDTGMAGFPDFQYSPMPQKGHFFGYRLCVNMAFGLDFDSLYYWPPGNNRDLSPSYERLADNWVFFDD